MQQFSAVCMDACARPNQTTIVIRGRRWTTVCHNHLYDRNWRADTYLFATFLSGISQCIARNTLDNYIGKL